MSDLVQKQSGKIRVLVVDDSALMRKRISDMINSDEECEVIATARNGEEALKTVSILKPDVITLDIELPKMDGVTALKYIMSEWPTPIVIVSGYTQYSGEETIKCLEYGAIDLVIKPSGPISIDIDKVKDELLTKIKAANRANLKIFRPFIAQRPAYTKPQELITDKLVVIASSTGGPRALVDLLPNLSADLPAAVLVIQHMPEGFTHAMAQRLNLEAKIIIKEAQDGEQILQGKALIAPGGFNLLLEHDISKGPIVRLQKGPRRHGVCPCADITMESVGPLYKQNCLGVILTGMGNDGVEGLRIIKENGGKTISQDQSTSVVYGMPKAAIDAKVADKVLPIYGIAEQIMSWAKGYW